MPPLTALNDWYSIMIVCCLRTDSYMSPINFAPLYPATCSISIAGTDEPVCREICSLSLLIVSIDEANCGKPCN